MSSPAWPGGDPLSAIELVPDVYLLRGIRGCNVYYLADPKTPAIIDAGLPFNRGRVARAIHRLRPSLPPPQWLLVTHYHIDHAGGAAEARRTLDAPVVTHKAEVEAFVHGRSQARVRAYTARIAPDLTVHDGEVLPVLGGVEVLHTPGHTPGSLCFRLPRYEAIFTGDLFVSYRDRLSRPFMGPESDSEAFADSLARIAALEPRVLFPGHGYPVMDGATVLLSEMAGRRGKSLGWRARARNLPRLVRFSLGMWRDLDYPRPRQHS